MRIHSQEQVDDAWQLLIGLERQSPRSRHVAAQLICVMRRDEEVRESDIPAYDPIGILEEGGVNRIADGLCGPLIRRDEAAAVRLICRLQVNPVL